MDGVEAPTRPLRGTSSSGGGGSTPPPVDEPAPPAPQPPGTSPVRTVVGFIGRALITLGILVLLFVAYQLWGTGFYEARAQNDLQGQFEDQLAQVEADLGGGAGEGDVAVPLEPVAVAEGDAAFKLELPAIGVERIAVEGIDIPDLRKGPGHYPETPLPGEIGNAAIAGHRTTYGQPFHNLDKLEDGDEIIATTLTGTYVYEVVGTAVVAPTAIDVLAPPGENTYVENKGVVEGDAMITLTTCNPKYSASQRLVVFGKLNPLKSPETVPASVDANLSTGRSTIDEAGLSGEGSSRLDTLLFGLLAAAIGALWWFAFHRWRKWYVWLAGVLPFLAGLFVFYTYLERMLPGNY